MVVPRSRGGGAPPAPPRQLTKDEQDAMRRKKEAKWIEMHEELVRFLSQSFDDLEWGDEAVVPPVDSRGGAGGAAGGRFPPHG